MSNPLCVCISDIHFNINNLELSSKALYEAIQKSNQLGIPLVIAGDLNDTKAIIRAEVANRLITLLESAIQEVYILVGNHDLINEKGSEHGLNYLRPYANIVQALVYLGNLSLWLIPYHSSSDDLKNLLPTIPLGSRVIMHQGFLGASMGEYITDKSSIDPELVKDFTVISGHYHKHQTLGTVTYIGSPFSMSFGESNDGPKGFLVLNEDGTFTREILGLRRHVIIEGDTTTEPVTKSDDLIWYKIKGTRSELNKLDKKKFAGYKLDLIPTDSEQVTESTENLKDYEIFDLLIDKLSESGEYKSELKGLWRDLLETDQGNS